MKKTIMVLGLILITALFIVGCSDNETTGAASVKSSNELVKIPLDSVTNKMQKFDYNANGIKVTYFVVKGTDDKIRTAFDACDVCGGSKGYHQEGNDVVCNKCGLSFSILGLGTKNKGAGCWPSYLSHEIKDNEIIIKISEIATGAFRFV